VEKKDVPLGLPVLWEVRERLLLLACGAESEDRTCRLWGVGGRYGS
jgi:hypothetical protein